MAAVAVIFHGPISHPATIRFRNALCQMVNEAKPDGARKYDKLYLLMNSAGGSLDDGISLYSLIRMLPMAVTTVNMGFIASIAVIPFLAGSNRISTPNGCFHFHQFDWTFDTSRATRSQLSDYTQILDSARGQAFEILKSQTLLTETDFEQLKLMNEPVVKGAAFAKEKGIIQEIEFPALPANTPIFNVDY
ncbi:hypothetical protein FRZ44_14140 [Hypericibacter terrae]|uniref:ATP-dependent Clp protease proteolytic subunit n=1 Tax=Hypericibacter terrae TaxID=2602015 RepID=A0A5J6MF98_9PROT|nr:ATP-dependent Clp protease proteolytic subunit [Hypericibacter terrae]QEX16122.1 hypothetical protein FRZ44_14140 [Hypericibacter terrae]